MHLDPDGSVSTVGRRRVAGRQLARLNSVLFQGTAKTAEGGAGQRRGNGAEEEEEPGSLCDMSSFLRRRRAMAGGLLPLLVGALPSARASLL